jgi:hypothetical protein
MAIGCEDIQAHVTHGDREGECEETVWTAKHGMLKRRTRTRTDHIHALAQHIQIHIHTSHPTHHTCQQRSGQGTATHLGRSSSAAQSGPPSVGPGSHWETRLHQVRAAQRGQGEASSTERAPRFTVQAFATRTRRLCSTQHDSSPAAHMGTLCSAASPVPAQGDTEAYDGRRKRLAPVWLL